MHGSRALRQHIDDHWRGDTNVRASRTLGEGDDTSLPIEQNGDLGPPVDLPLTALKTSSTNHDQESTVSFVAPIMGYKWVCVHVRTGLSKFLVPRVSFSVFGFPFFHFLPCRPRFGLAEWRIERLHFLSRRECSLFLQSTARKRKTPISIKAAKAQTKYRFVHRQFTSNFKKLVEYPSTTTKHTNREKRNSKQTRWILRN